MNSFDVNVFGAHDLPCGMAKLFGWPEQIATPLFAILAVAMVTFAAVLALRCDVPARLALLTDLEATSLLA